MNKRLFNRLQKEGLKELLTYQLKDCWWTQGPRYTLQLYHSGGDRKGRVYVGSITVKKEIPKEVQYKDGKYVLDLAGMKERDLPAHYIPYIKFD